MATYTTTADANGDFAINFDTTYNGGQKINVESDKDGVTREIEIFAPSQYQEIPDANVVTWSGRTQREKNKDTVSPFDYGATGVVGTSTDSLYPTDDIFPSDDLFSGASDDTQAFARLEAEHTGRIVDLQGFSFYVDSAPTKNNYIGGKFITPNTVGKTPIGDKEYITRPQLALLNARTDTSQKNSNPFIKFRQTVFYRNSIQGTAIDEVNRHIYTVQDADAGCRVIVQHTLDGGEFANTLKGMNGTTLFSHSGIGIENANDGVHLWACGIKNDTDETYANAVKAYRFKPVLIDFNASIYTTIDNSFEKTEYTLYDTPTAYENMNIAVSYDQKWLIAMNRNLVSGHFVFRFWELSKLVEGGSGDYRDAYTYEIVAKAGNEDGEVNFQGMSSCGDCFYVIGGGYYADQVANPTDPKCQLFVWDLAGNVIQHKYNVDIAMEAMAAAAGATDAKVREVEAINFMKINGSLTPVVTVAGSRNTTEGQSTTRQQWLVALGYGSPIKNVTQNLGVPSFVSVADDDSLDYAASLDYSGQGSLKLGVVDRSSEKWELLKLSKDGSTVNKFASGAVLSYAMDGNAKGWIYVGSNNFSTIMADGINYNIGTSEKTLWRFMNTGELRPNETNTFDIGSASYRVKKAYINNINIGALSVFADNATAKIGGLVVGDVYRTATGQLMIVY